MLLCKTTVNNSSSIFNYLNILLAFSYMISRNKAKPCYILLLIHLCDYWKNCHLFQAPKINVGFKIIFCFCIFFNTKEHCNERETCQTSIYVTSFVNFSKSLNIFRPFILYNLSSRIILKPLRVLMFPISNFL